MQQFNLLKPDAHTCLFMVAIAFVTPFIACAIASVDFKAVSLRETA